MAGHSLRVMLGGTVFSRTSVDRSGPAISPHRDVVDVSRLSRGRSRSRKGLAILSAGAWLLNPAALGAHDWYPAWCCNDKDCRALSEEQGETALEAPDGWHLWDGRIATRDSARPSPDTKFHLCEEATTKAIICFFVPPGST